MILCLLSGWLPLGKSIAISAVAVENGRMFWRAIVAERVWVTSGLCSTRYSARAHSNSSFRHRLSATDGLQKFDVLTRRRQKMSVIAKTPAAAVGKALIEAR